MISKTYSAFLLIAAGLLLMTSCSKHLSKQKKQEAIIYPAPPDSARIQYLTTIKSSTDVVKKKSKFNRFIMGEDAPLPVVKPYGISMYNGKMVVCDIGVKGLEMLDFNKGTFEYFVPKGQGQFKMPINNFIDENGILYVADVDRHQIVVFDRLNNYINCFGDTGNFKPTDVFAFGDKVYVADSKNNRINIYKKGSYKLLDYIPKIQKGDTGFLFQPSNIFVNKDHIYVSDFGDFKIKVYTHEGVFVRSVGSYGKNIGQFARPKGIAVDSAENLFVVDAGFENVQVFNNEGKLLMFFGGSYKGPGDMWLPTKVIIDYNNLKYFSKHVDPAYELKYLIFVANQFGPDKINVYGAITPATKKQ